MDGPRYCGYYPCECRAVDPMGFEHPGKFNNWTGELKTELTAQDEVRAVVRLVQNARCVEDAEHHLRTFVDRIIAYTKQAVEKLVPSVSPDSVRAQIQFLEGALENSKKEIDAMLRFPEAIRVREGGGPEDYLKSLAVTIHNLRRQSTECELYKTAVENAHSMLNQCGILPVRDSSHKGLVERIRIAQGRFEQATRERDAAEAEKTRARRLFENMCEAENKLSDAYLRVRQILGLDHFTAGTTPEQMWQSVEATVSRVMADNAALKTCLSEANALGNRLEEVRVAQLRTIRQLTFEKNELLKSMEDERRVFPWFTLKPEGGAKLANPDQLTDALVKELYFQLLYAVARKHDGETRHETALRYIRQTEERATSGHTADAEKA